MPSYKRHQTRYPGVYYINGTSVANGKTERIYYIYYRRNGKQIEEKVGRQYKDNMTPARASKTRAMKIDREQLSNREKREKKNNRYTITDLWEEYKTQKNHLKGLMIDNNRFIKHIQPIFGNKEPYEILQSEVDTFRIRLSKKKPQTVKNILELLRRIINFGVRKKLCDNIDFSIEMPEVNNITTEDLSPAQLSKLIEAIEKDDNKIAGNFMLMTLFTGMRRGELFRLRWDDIDFQRGFIHIRDQRDQKGPKGGKDQIIPLNAAARELLASHPHTDSEYVFPGLNGKQRVDIKRPVNRIKKNAGLPKNFRPLHGLRHVYASMLASSGEVDMYTLQKLLTHKSPQMTQRYAHLRDDALIKASNLAGEMVRNISKE